MIFHKSIVVVLPVLSLWACDPVRSSSVISSVESQEAHVKLNDPLQAEAGETAELCNVVVSFTSVCSGVNQPLQIRVNDLVASDSRIVSTSMHPWGREGEVDMCLRTRNVADAGSLTRDIEAIIASDRRAPPVTVRQGVKPQTGYAPPADLSTDQRVPGT